MMNKETIIAIIRIVLPCVVSVLGVLGITNVYGIELDSISTDQAAAFAAAIIGAVASLYTGWKNNNVTEEAKIAQLYLDGLKER